MFVKMSKTTPGSRDGRFTEQFLENETYDLSDAADLADVFVKTLKVAKEVKAPVVKVAKEVEKTPAEELGDKSLDDMTGAELKILAEAKEIDITGIKKVPDLRAAVKAGLEPDTDGENNDDENNDDENNDEDL